MSTNINYLLKSWNRFVKKNPYFSTDVIYTQSQIHYMKISWWNTRSRMACDSGAVSYFACGAKFQTSQIETSDFKRFTAIKKQIWKRTQPYEINVYIATGFYLPRYSWFGSAFTGTTHSANRITLRGCKVHSAKACTRNVLADVMYYAVYWDSTTIEKYVDDFRSIIYENSHRELYAENIFFNKEFFN